MSDNATTTSSLPLTFGRILVRVVLSEPRLDPAPPVFQRVYEPSMLLSFITHYAFAHFAPSLPSGDRRIGLYFEHRELARLETSGGWYLDTDDRPLSPLGPKTVGDWLNMRTDDQTTLGTVQFELRCVASADMEVRR